MIPGTVTVHLISPEPVPAEVGWRLLSPEERTRAASFLFPIHAGRWIACRAALRRILGNIIHVPPEEVPLEFTDLGKPYLAEPYDDLNFSLSHCEHIALLALSVDGPIGVDVETTNRAAELPGCESTYCHPDEIKDLPLETGPRATKMMDLWIAKEALLKALGTGFIHPPDSVRIICTGPYAIATSDIPLAGIEDQAIHRLTHPALEGFCAAVSVPACVSRIVILQPANSDG